MNLYQTQHPFYCGIDLHAKEMYACVIDQSGNKLLHRNFNTRQPEKLFDQLKPYGCDVIVGCESTFNWYWLCDACEEKKIPFILGHALYLKAIHGGKVKSDKIDSEKLARSWQSHLGRQELRFTWQEDEQPLPQVGIQRDRPADQTRESRD